MKEECCDSAMDEGVGDGGGAGSAHNEWFDVGVALR